MSDGTDDTPKQQAATDRLMRYWSHGAGAATIQWGRNGDYNRCLIELGKYVSPDTVHGLCANLHHQALGIWPATHAKQERDAQGK